MQKNLILFLFLSLLLFPFISHATPSSVTLSSLPSFVGNSTLDTPGTEGGELAIGDFNCDGTKDLILSSPGYSTSISDRLLGRIYIQFGGSSFSTTTTISTSMDVTITGSTTYDYLGRNILITDVDDDGCDDILALGAGTSSVPSDLYVFLGNASWSGSYTNSSSVYDYKISTSATGSYYSYLHHLGALDGDLDGDSDVDNQDSYIAICSDYTTTCYVMALTNALSTSSTIESLSDYSVTSSDPSESIASGDLDNDGYDDLIVGNPDTTSNDAVYIFFGPLSSKSTTTFSADTGALTTGSDIVIQDTDTSAGNFGELVSSSDIIDPDSGYSDLIIGSSVETVDGMSNVGRIHIISGESLAAIKPSSSTGYTLANDTSTTSTDYNYGDLELFYYCSDDSSSYLGLPYNSHFNGDFNGDGKTDIVVGSYLYSGGSMYGRSYIIYGGAFDNAIGSDVQLSSSSSYSDEYYPNKYVAGSSSSDTLSSNVVVGDITGDGLDEIIIAAEGYNSSYGITYIVDGEVTDVDGDGVDSADDIDGDGVYEALDCNDNDSTVGSNTWYADNDSDGYGDSGDSLEVCEQPSGYVDNDSDCDDSDSSISPDGSESCDGVDNNCDGSTDEGVTTTYYLDADGDGYGDISSTSEECSLPSGYVEDDTDCNDSSSAIFPGAGESCDGVDNDCDGSTDEGVMTTYYLDSDSDGFGDSDETSEGCSEPSGYVVDDTDCDDDSSDANPDAEEVCEDGIDNDCDGADDTCETHDDDGDGVTLEDGDCDDEDATVYPGADELGDALDNDCDDRIDEGLVDIFMDDLDNSAALGDSFSVNFEVNNESGFTDFDLEIIMQKSPRTRRTSEDGSSSGWIYFFPLNSTCSDEDDCETIESDTISQDADGTDYTYTYTPTMPSDRDEGEYYFVQVRLTDPDTGEVIGKSQTWLTMIFRPFFLFGSGSWESPFIYVE